MNIEQLRTRYPDVKFEEGQGGQVRIKVDAGADGAEGELYLLGAHVASFRPPDGEQVLWISRESVFEEGSPIRGGIPVCFPWFGVNTSGQDLPNHGLVRQRVWQPKSIRRNESGVTSILEIDSDDETVALWPYHFKLELAVVLSKRLSVDLTVHNIGGEDFTITEALHTYLSVSDIHAVSVEGLDGVEYIDKLSSSDKRSRQQGAISFAGETDRVYLDTAAACAVVDPGMNRKIVLEKRGSESTVVWNPWIEKAKRMPDYGDNEWTDMVCVETANALDNEVTVPAGGSHTIGVTVFTGSL
jgi:D-hexose-6-phosphate mutarotase